jgi:hypothetical protein
MSSQQAKTCFVVGPIGNDDSDDRIHADWLLEEIIQPVFEEKFPAFSVTRADKISEPGRIDAQVISALLDSDLVIADLTTLNPNAFYEIGIRHMVQKPIIHMHLEGESIPFDVGMFRSIKFSRRTPDDLRKARATLESVVQATISADHQIDNPVTVARGKIELQQSASSAETVLLNEIQTLKNRFANIERTVFRGGTFRRPQRFRIDLSPGSSQATHDFQRHAKDMIDMLFPSYQSEPNGDLVVTIYVEDNPDNREALNVLKREAADAEYQLSVS